jgi:uroporphyrinogen decarboxylase
MNPRERVLKALRREGAPDRVPFEISWGAFTPRLMKTYRKETGSELEPDEYFDFDTRYVRPLPSNKKTDFTQYFKGEELEEDVSFDDWGVGSVPTAFEIPDFKYHPLEKMTSVEEIDQFEWPDLDLAYRYKDLQSNIDEYHQRGYAVNADLYQTIFETAWLMRGMETFLMDFYINPDIVKSIISHLTELRIKQVQYFTEMGVDVIRLGDDITTQRGLMFSKEMYQEFFKPQVKRIIDAAKQINPDVLVFMHACGKVEEMVEDFIDLDVDILNPVQPECNDISMLKEKYGDKISFWGGIGVQSVMPNGTPEEVKAAVANAQSILGKNGGYLMAPAHILDPAIPWENIVAFIDAAKAASYK